MYDTARAALQELENDQVFERVALHVLRSRFPELRITSVTGDLGRDAFSRPLFGKDDKVVLWVSLQQRWTSKLQSELVKNRGHGRQAEAIYVTNRSTNEKTKERWRTTARNDYGVALEIVTLAELVTELETDGLRWVAELELGVHPRAPHRLSTWAQYLDVLAGAVPGMAASLVGREAELEVLGAALAEEGPMSRVVVVEGPGGVGKTRLAIEASRAVSAVLVAPTGVSLEASAFTEAPVDDSLVILVDDADRAPDLSGLPALLHDQRFRQVRFLLTVRPGRRLGLLQRWGMERWGGPVVELRPLERSAIDALVTGHGISSPAFRQSVIHLAQGNPLIAHTACEAGLAAKRFDWSGAVDLLRATADRRLPADDPAQEHRAAAVALALLGPVTGGEDLAALAGALSTLPPEPHRLSVLLDELADMGLADASPYSVRPALLAPVLIAGALDPQSRVRLDVDRALGLLLQRAGLGAGQDADSAGEHVVFGGAGLGSQLNTLAQAAHDCGDDLVGARLASAVRALLPDEADLGAWAAVVGLGREVAVAAPGILAELYGLLVQRWPLAPTSRLGDGGDPVAAYRYGLLRLGERFAELAQHVGLDTAPSPVSVVLDVAWLMEPGLSAEGSDRRDGILRGIEQWCSAPAHTLPAGFDALFERRREVLRVITQWCRDRAVCPPEGLRLEDAAVRGPVSLARVLLAAVQPLLHLTVESTGGSPESADTMTLQAHVLPDRPETLTLLREVLALLVPLLDDPSLRSAEGLPILHTLVSLPGRLRSESARPLAISGTPLPGHAITVLDTAAAEFTVQISARWNSLPLSVKRSATQAVLGPDPRPYTLSGAAAAADAVAVAAQEDTVLARLLVLQPLSDRTPWRDALEAQHRAAKQLGSETDLLKALVLLDETAPNVTGVAVSALPAFAQAVGASADDPSPALERIARAPLAGEAALLAGLIRRHPDVVWPWLEDHASDPRLAGAALALADEYPQCEGRLLTLLLQRASDRLAAGDEVASRLAGTLCWHLVGCKQPLAQRMAVLASLAQQGPAEVLPESLQVIGFLLQEAGKAGDSIEGEVAGKFADALRRRFSEAEQISKTVQFDEDTAYGAAAIASSFPEEFGAVIVEQLLATDGKFTLPHAWDLSLERLKLPVRAQLVSAFLQQMDEARAAGEISDRTELAAARLLSALGQETEEWAGLVRQWASGSPAQRQRAAASVQYAWQTPLWTEIVSSLLSAGIDAASRGALLEGIVLPGLTRDLPDELQPRRDALAPLLTDATAAVRAFASDALHRINILEEEDRRREADFRRGYRR
ncbi:hypothetical protein ACFW9L_16420 [Streptomyces sp. NPDC059517]|uniref:hypothetical protein n=1 Tax=Streptomyces sp. NPDC059517 TaxID=3346855 RepID=UPI00368808EE